MRKHWQYLARALAALGPAEIDRRAEAVRRLVREHAVTYHVYGDAQGSERPWDLDPIPFLIGSEEWAAIESGLVQRAEVLNLLLKDLYGPRELIKKGLLPAELVYGHGGFLRPCANLPIPPGHWLTVYAADLARGSDGAFWVLADGTQAPSGSGYALANRMVISRALPSLYRDSQVHRLALYFLAQCGDAELAVIPLDGEVTHRVPEEVLALGPLRGRRVDLQPMGDTALAL